MYEAITGFSGAHEFLSWGPADVAAWLREQVDLPRAAEIFEQQGVSGSRLTGLTEQVCLSSTFSLATHFLIQV